MIRASPQLATLRRRDVYDAFRRAIVVSLARRSFRVVHLSIQRTHVHLLVEAADYLALARGMQGLQISAAKHVNRALDRRRGAVFPDRYHASYITSPRGARHALAYVLNNWRKHREHRAPALRGLRLDPFSTAATFHGWRHLDDPLAQFPRSYTPLPVSPPRTWLLATGWRRHGLLAPTEIPGARRPKR